MTIYLYQFIESRFTVPKKLGIYAQINCKFIDKLCDLYYNIIKFGEGKPPK